MKKFLSIILAGMMAVSLAACTSAPQNDTAADSDMDYISGNGKMVIGYTINEPMNYEEDGELTGFDT
ncbi:MAG: amino acid ABC transporter substrate-binding protein, partial [Clostridia bacterium]|nr:amino acid ABC transporter substrate-binding protein [Clostridia bacterium]